MINAFLNMKYLFHATTPEFTIVIVVFGFPYDEESKSIYLDT